MASFDQLSARERRYVIGLGAVFAILVLVLIPLRVANYFSEREKDNESLKQALENVQRARGRLAARRASLGDVAARYAKPAPRLGVLIDSAAKASKFEIDNQSDIQPIPRGKLYIERATKLRAPKTGLKPLALFLEAIETSGYPVAITQFEFAKQLYPDSFVVNMTLSAYDRTDVPTGGSPTSGAPVPAGANGGGAR